jgi:hypothetical protein
VLEFGADSTMDAETKESEEESSGLRVDVLAAAVHTVLVAPNRETVGPEKRVRKGDASRTSTPRSIASNPSTIAVKSSNMLPYVGKPAANGSCGSAKSVGSCEPADTGSSNRPHGSPESCGRPEDEATQRAIAHRTQLGNSSPGRATDSADAQSSDELHTTRVIRKLFCGIFPRSP